MIDLTIPDEVWDAVAAAVPIESVVAAEGSAWDISTLVQRGVEAAAPLILAAAYDRIAESLTTHRADGSKLSEAPIYPRELRARASVLRGEGDPK